MTEDVVRMTAQLAALQSEMQAEIAFIEGMKAENAARLADGLSIAYTMNNFHACSAALLGMAKKMRDCVMNTEHSPYCAYKHYLAYSGLEHTNERRHAFYHGHGHSVTSDTLKPECARGCVVDAEFESWYDCDVDVENQDG